MTTIRADAHGPEFLRKMPPQLPVRCATTANITIATGLNVGDAIDGQTLADGDRVLVKNQTTGSQNGIYIAGAAPDRSFDMFEGLAAWGALVYVIAGTANGGKLFKNTNATVPTIGTTALTFVELAATETLPVTLIDAKGDLIVGTAADVAARLAVGANGTVLTADSTQATGQKWATPAGGAPSGAAGGDLSGTYPNPQVVDDSHNHTAATAPGGGGGGGVGSSQFVIDGFTGDGTTTAYTLSAPPPGGKALVLLNGVAVLPADYTISGVSLVFDTAPASTDEILVVQPTGTGAGTVITIPFLIDGGGALPAVGIKGDLTLPFACTITGWRILGDQSGSVVVDTWRDTYASFLAGTLVVADSIWAGAKPTVSGARGAEATGLSIAVAAGDVLRFNLDSVTSMQRLTLSLTATRS